MDPRSLHRSRRRRPSQDTFHSLMQLDPTPIENDKELPPLPDNHFDQFARAPASPGSTSASLGLSGSGRGAVYYLSRIQRYSSYTFTIFTTVHLATTSLVPLVTRSVSSSESYLLLSREIYQTRLSEPLLVVIPLVAHVASGLILRLVRRSQNLRRYGGSTVAVLPLRNAKSLGPTPHQRALPPFSYTAIAGYFAAGAVAAHAFVNRYLPLTIEGDSADVGLAYVAHGFALHPTVSWGAYVGLLAFTSGHFVWGWARWLGLAETAAWESGMVGKDVRRRRRRSWLLINSAAVLGALIWAAGGLGVVARGGRARGWVGKLYDGLFEKLGISSIQIKVANLYATLHASYSVWLGM